MLHCVLWMVDTFVGLPFGAEQVRVSCLLLLKHGLMRVELWAIKTKTMIQSRLQDSVGDLIVSKNVHVHLFFFSFFFCS